MPKLEAMKMSWLFALCIFGVAGSAYAEGGCPAGMIPHRGTDITSCGPIPPGYYGSSGDVNAPPPSKPIVWADRWGAIAFSDINNSVGVSTDMASENAAQQAAIAECISAGGERCSTEMTYHNQCGVIAWGDRYANAAGAPTLEEASDMAMKTCGRKTENCKVVYSNCTSAQRIQ